MNIQQSLAEVAIQLPHILLPNKEVDYSKFAVIACDQYSANKNYWGKVKSWVGNAPSSLNIILPEAYLGQNDKEAVQHINTTMKSYLENHVFQTISHSLVYVRRHTTTGIRKGLVVALDLDLYDYTSGSTSMIRATELTIVDRLPMRIAIRENASVEIPHIMVLINDKKDALMSILEKEYKQCDCLYDFELMMNGGHISGYQINQEKILADIAKVLKNLLQENKGFLYAIGDGNHSLAAAKAIWEKIKPTLSAEQKMTHPARYSLVELVNLYDPALKFEPIHRLVMNVDTQQLEKDLNLNPNQYADLQVLQPKLDEWLKHHPQAELEYIHGEEECRELGKKPNHYPIIFGEFEKDSLFEVVETKGAFVRKSFSMGEANDKRFYLEAKRIQ